MPLVKAVDTRVGYWPLLVSKARLLSRALREEITEMPFACVEGLHVGLLRRLRNGEGSWRERQRREAGPVRAVTVRLWAGDALAIRGATCHGGRARGAAQSRARVEPPEDDRVLRGG